MEQMKKMPLEGIRVVELATVVAAPTASRVLCAFGAEVIKVETKIGDEMRRAGEFEMVVCEDDKNPLFTIQNSGKLLTSIDLKNPDGKAAFLKLLETADVFLTNVRLPSLGRLGLDYETLHKAYPGLVYAHFSGFGPKGPDAAKPGFDSTAFWLRSGPMADWPAVHALLHVQLHRLGFCPERWRSLTGHGGDPLRQPLQRGVRLHFHVPHGPRPARCGVGDGSLAGVEYCNLQPPLL